MVKEEVEIEIIDQCLIGRRICRWKRNYDKFIMVCGFDHKVDGWAVDTYGNPCPFQEKKKIVVEEVI